MISTLARASAILVLLGSLAACGGGGQDAPGSSAGSSGSGDSTGKSVSIDGSDALQWGDGDYGVVLAHGAAFDAASWEAQAAPIAEQGTTVLAVEDISPEAIGAAVRQLQDSGVERVALVGGSAGSDAILQLASQQPDLPDQLILLSPNGTVSGLGEEPKLFIASEDEPVANVSTELADSAPGEDNEAKLLTGSAHAQNIFDTDQGDDVLALILDRLKEFSAS